MKSTEPNRKRIALVALLALVAAAPVFAQDEAAEEAPEPLWKSALGLSYVATTGNTDTSTFGLDFSSKRRPTPWGLELVATFTRAEDSNVVTAEQYLVGGRALRELNHRWSVFAGLSWARDPFSGFDNRWIAETGAQYLALDTPHHTLSFDAGLTWTSEDRILVDEPTQEEYTETFDWFGAVAGLSYEWTISDSASLTERLLYYPNFDVSSDWRLASDTALKASLTKMLALQLGYQVRYRNQPIDDNVKTDTTTKMSVVLNF
jgi:putative salt-induced outer membrane protein